MYDVIIVGCGVSGGYLASLLKGLNVLVLEKNKKVILKDSGIVSSHFSDFIDAPLIHERVKEMRIVSPSGIKFSVRAKKPFAYILKRREFSSFLRKSARKNAELKYGAVRSISYNDGCASVATAENEYKAKIVVGCDGALSLVRRTLGIPLPCMQAGLLVRTRRNVNADEISVFFNKYFSPESFSWIIPQTNEYGLMTSIRPMESLKYFRQKLDLPEGELHGSFMPVGHCRSYANRTLLVGDSCGQAKPLTGGGIIFSLRAARHAAAVIRTACEKDRYDPFVLREYERMWKQDFGREIALQLLAKKLYRKMTNRDIDGLFVKFGYAISKAKFDYDRLSTLAKSLPKVELMKFLLPRIGHLL